MPDPRPQSFEEFLQRFWQEVDAGTPRPVDDWVALCPEWADRIRAEYGDGLAPPHGRAWDEAGGRVGRYLLERRLTGGAMGVLFVGTDPELNRPVLLKTVRALAEPFDPGAVERFRREARIGGRLRHHGLCPILDVVTAHGRLFAVMPYFEGEDLAEWIHRARSGQPGSADGNPHVLDAWVAHAELRPVLHLVEKVARAVHAAHEAGVVHRDLKPSNILVRHDGEPVVLDFGLAVELETGREARLTQDGDALGTPHYMAPEQVEGRLDRIDRRTDVYALGVMLYEVATLQVPFQANTRAQLMQRILTGDPPPLRRLAPAVPRDLEAICSQAMAVEPRRRYPNALELAEDLRRFQTLEATRARPLSATGRWLRRARRYPVASAALTCAVLAVVALLLALWRNWALEAGADAIGALTRVWDATQDGKPADPADLRVVHEGFDDPRDAAVCVELAQSGDVKAAIDLLLRSLPVFRSADEDERARLLRPRGKIGSTVPAFRFEAPDASAGERSWVLHVVSFGAPPVVVTQSASTGPDGVVECTWPADRPLQVGVEYRWNVQLEPPPSDASDRWPPQAVTFRIAQPPPAPAKSSELAVLEHAAALLRTGFTTAAIDRLSELSPRRPSWQAAIRDGLLAKALRELEDRDGLERLAREVAGTTGR